MNKIKLVVIIGSLGIVMAACEKNVYFDVDTQENKLVVNAIVQPDSMLKAVVSLSVDPLAVGFDAARVNDATIKIYRNDIFAGNFDADIDGYYHIDPATLNAQPGDKLNMEVSAPNRETVTAETVIPTAVPIESVEITDTVYVKVSYYVSDSLGNYYTIDTLVPHYEIQLTFTDPPGEDHYSLAIDYQDAYSESYTCFSSSDPAFLVDGNYDFGGEDENGTVTLCNEAYFTDISFQGTKKTITVNLLELPTDFILDAKFIFRLRHLSSDYYDYLVSSSLQYDNNGNPFSEPVTVFSNIQNGFGVFAGLSVSFVEIDL